VYAPLHDARNAMNARTALTTVFVFLFALLGGARAWECPTFDEEKVMQVLQVCLADADGLCGDACVPALVNGALAVKDEIEIPCTGGIDGVLENVLKRCTEENGGTFDPCDGKVEDALRRYASETRCVEGGTLADFLSREDRR
jgi:hypothetical protein